MVPPLPLQIWGVVCPPSLLQPPANFCPMWSWLCSTKWLNTNECVIHQAEQLKADGTTAADCEEQLQEIEHCITVFLRENGEPGSLSLAGIITLCPLHTLQVIHIFLPIFYYAVSLHRLMGNREVAWCYFDLSFSNYCTVFIQLEIPEVNLTQLMGF